MFLLLCGAGVSEFPISEIAARPQAIVEIAATATTRACRPRDVAWRCREWGFGLFEVRGRVVWGMVRLVEGELHLNRLSSLAHISPIRERLANRYSCVALAYSEYACTTDTCPICHSMSMGASASLKAGSYRPSIEMTCGCVSCIG